ncbi:pentatricopeptide repeat-containing protein At1g08070, chloroplastic [Malania oleifera]|uniref:pentatricopeptide repeat-containing protein At1g08070, chloroplastic n=1 Tax=Malania oleifera TaxID=397392 RepID=UPI0025ADBCFD|nr:pentatricopeptide repeat-containing protein At1g08070, chloroplastic [Malania oleifera]
MLMKVTEKPPHILLEERFISLLHSCRTSKQLHQIQNQIIVHGLQHNQYVAPKVVSACAFLKKIAYACQMFLQIPNPNVMLWNAMLRGYADNELYKEVISLFSRMRSADIRPNCFTFPVVLKSCGKVFAIREGKEMHCFSIKLGFRSNSFVGTTLIDMYSGGGEIGSAYKVFGEMLLRNVVTWTSMVNGYILCRDINSARRLFDLTPERDVILWNTMVSGYIEFGDMLAARKLFDEMPNRDVMSWNTVLSGYANNGDIEACKKLFEDIPNRNVFSWNGLIGGYCRYGQYFEVLGTFKRMLTECDVLPNDATLVTVLSACARLGAVDLGKWIHVYAESNGFKGNVYVGNALIDMYAKCGIIENAIDVFKSMDSKDLISWNSIIGGLAMHGRGADALRLFSLMRNGGVKPDGVTFIGLLCACTHMGLVEDGFSYFQSMVGDCAVVPQIEHYGCMVDLLARAGFLDQAVDFVGKMPMEADGVIWTALLGACRIYKNVEVAELALERLIELEPKNPANYVMLSNIYGNAGRWVDVARLKVAMRDTCFKKIPGCSLIEVNDGVVEFYSLDERHPQSGEIYGALRGLTKLLRFSVYVTECVELEL